jgi:hypothetical protein
METPKRVKIGGQVFKIEERTIKQDGTLNDSSYGYTIDAGNIIVLDINISLNKKQQTLLHEIIHVITMVYAGQVQPKPKDEYDVWEHHFIGLWEAPMLSFIKDNPDVVKWMQIEEDFTSGAKKEIPASARAKTKR